MPSNNQTDLPPIEEERAIVERLRGGDREAAGVLFQWFADGLYRRAILPRLPNREAAEDVLKDTFRIALERIEQFKNHDRSIFFWLRRIAINRSIDVHRARQRDRKASHYSETTIERTMSQPPPAPDRAPEIADTKELVEAALAQMNPRYAQALRMRLIEDHDREICAQALDVTVGNFDVILHRAAKAFRKVYSP
ncbi:MAG: RNA polymerase sigma factor [Myxococcota bacterium]